MTKLSLENYLSLKYWVSIYPEQEGGYTALIPDLPGCMTQGETLEEVVFNIFGLNIFILKIYMMKAIINFQKR